MCMCTSDFRGRNCEERKESNSYCLHDSVGVFFFITANIIPVAPTIMMGPRDHFVNLFSKINLTCLSTGLPFPSIMWFKDNQQLMGRNLQYLFFQEALLTDRGFYHCVAMNSVGTAMSFRAVVNFRGMYSDYS